MLSYYLQFFIWNASGSNKWVQKEKVLKIIKANINTDNEAQPVGKLGPTIFRRVINAISKTNNINREKRIMIILTPTISLKTEIPVNPWTTSDTKFIFDSPAIRGARFVSIVVKSIRDLITAAG